MNVVARLQEAGFEVLTRKEWGTQHEALYQSRRKSRPCQLPVEHFFAHVTVTPDSGEFTGDFKKDVRLVESIGFQRFGTGISYTWIVDQRSGLIAQGHPLDAKGAHTLNDKNISGFPFDLNAEGHAIAWIAVPGDRPSQACRDSYSAIIAAEKEEGAAQREAKIYPHSKFAAKDCPLESLRRHLPDILRNSTTILKGSKEEGIVASIQELMDHIIKPAEGGKPAITVADGLRASVGLRGAFDVFRDREFQRDKALAEAVAAIAEEVKDDATKAKLQEVLNALNAQANKLQTIDDQVS